MKESVGRTVARATLIYVLVAGLWIVLSDLTLNRVFDMPGDLQRWQTLKGFLFVLVSGGVLAILFTRYLRQRSAVQDKRQQAEHRLQGQVEQLRSAHERISTITGHAPIMMAFVEPGGRHSWVNRCWEETLGWAAEEAMSRDILEELVPDSGDRRLMREFIDRTSGRWRDFKVQRKDGLPVIAEWLVVALSDGRKVLFGRDVTHQKREELLRDRLFHYSRDLLGIMGFDGYLREINPAWEKLLGRSEQDLLSSPLIEFVHPEDAEMTARMFNDLASDRRAVQFETRFISADDAVKTVAWNAFSLPAEKLIFGVGRDMTAQKQVESQLLQAQRMESIGRLAGGVAHDFNNLLTIIMAQAQLALLEIDEQNPMATGLKEINLAGQKAAALTRQLLVFCRRQVLEPQNIDLNQIIEGMTGVIRQVLGEGVSLQIRPGPSIPLVRVDPTQMEQVLMNLAINGKDAMPAGGTLTIETRLHPAVHGEAPPSPKLPPGDYLVLKVTDTGSGIDPEVVERIFEPFFTTKGSAKGTGLGLSTVYSIVNHSGGDILVASVPGKETSFTIWLPAARGEADTPRVSPTVAQKGDETILVVDDDPGILGVLDRLLREFGYRTLLAGSPGSAVQISGEFPDEIDLLLTDVVMPGMNGRVLADTLRRQRPGLRVLFVSGYTDQILDEGALPEGTRFLPKPFTRIELAENVRTVLDSPPGKTPG